MDPVINPFVPGVGTPPPELVGREKILEEVRIAIEKVRRGLSAKSALMVGLRGVGKTVLRDRTRKIAEQAGIVTIHIEAPEKRSLPALHAPELRQCLLKISRFKQAHVLAERALRALSRFAKSLKVKYADREVSFDYEPELGLADNGDLEHDLLALFETTGLATKKADTAIKIFIDELQYVKKDELVTLITVLHRTAQRQHPIMLVGAGLPQLRALMGDAKSYAERLFNFPELAPCH